MPANILVSLDSLIVSMAIVMLGMPPLRAFRLCAAFMLCDGIATLTGLSSHGPFAPALFGIYVLLMLSLITRSPLRSAWWVPALFSLDNLLTGIAAKPSHESSQWIDSLSAASASGILALLGIAIGAAITKNAPARWLPAAGVMLLIAVAFL
jgi:hypothetical protein